MKIITALVAAFHHQPPTEAHVNINVSEGRIRAAAVANYMAGQASSLRTAWDATAQFDNPALAGEARMLQAGAAATEAMSNLLLAMLAGDKELFKHHFHAFVNDAVDTGVVSV